ncbi:MAG: universal stress protein [Bacteroidota bacterium]
MNIRNILILVDLSEATPSLLRYGLQLAASVSAEVWVQHIYYFPPDLAGEVRIPVAALEQYKHQAEQKLEALREEIALPIKQLPHFSVIRGDLIEQINYTIEECNIDLVIVGNRGGGLTTNILGSHTLKVIYHARCPVLSVPESVSFRPFNRIALATDWQVVSSKNVSQIKNLVKQWDAYLDVIHVSTDTKSEEGGLREPLGLERMPYTLHCLWERNIDTGLQKHIAQYQNNLLVLIPYQHSFFDRLFQKSITRQMVYHIQIPLLTLRE